MHARVRGTLTEAAGPFPAGTPYRADDPALLLWILACIVDSSVLVYDQYVASMDDDDRERYWQDYKVIGRHFGLADADLPATWADFRAYVDGVVASGDLVVTPRARELGLEIVMHPPVPVHLRPLVELANFVTVGLLPPGVRRAVRVLVGPGAGAGPPRRRRVPQAGRRAAAAAGRALRAQRAPGRRGLTPRRTASAPGPQAAQPAPGDARDGQRVLAPGALAVGVAGRAQAGDAAAARASAPS